jgi:hypothetical protein
VSTAPTTRPPHASAPELVFAVEDAAVLRHAAAPTLAFRVRVDAGAATVRSLMLAMQVRIDVTRRAYDAPTQERLVELFGEPSRWGQTLRSLLWTHATALVPPFTGRAVVEVPLSCTYDFDVAAAKYLHAVRDGEVPLLFLFSGTVFYAGPAGLQVARIGWDSEAGYRMPAGLWREMMDHYFPGSGWLRLGADTFDRLYAFKARRALASWDEAVEALLAAAGDEGGP